MRFLLRSSSHSLGWQMNMADNRTFLGIDYGERRIGVAKSDSTGLIASSLQTLIVKSDKDAAEKLSMLIAQWSPAGLVIGYPLHVSGKPSPKCAVVDRFIERLEKVFTGPIYRVDERYTSEEAAGIVHAHGKRAGKDKGRVDRLAAVLILQRFLDDHPTSAEHA